MALFGALEGDNGGAWALLELRRKLDVGQVGHRVRDLRRALF